MLGSSFVFSLPYPRFPSPSAGPSFVVGAANPAILMMKDQRSNRKIHITTRLRSLRSNVSKFRGLFFNTNRLDAVCNCWPTTFYERSKIKGRKVKDQRSTCSRSPPSSASGRWCTRRPSRARRPESCWWAPARDDWETALEHYAPPPTPRHNKLAWTHRLGNAGRITSHQHHARLYIGGESTKQKQMTTAYTSWITSRSQIFFCGKYTH